MDEQVKNEGMKGAMHGEDYRGCCGYGWGHGMHHFSVLRLILALFIVGIVFAFGVKVGEFKSSLYGYGYGMMDGGHWGMYGRYMMDPGYWGQNDYAPSASQPVSGNKTTTPTK